MHIGIVAPFNAASVVDLLDYDYRRSAVEIGGRTDTPVRNLVSAFLAAGNKLSIFTVETSAKGTREFHGPDLSLYMMPHRENQTAVLRDSFRDERKALSDSINQVKPDVVHSMWTHTGHALAALDSGLPSLCTIQDTALRYAWLNRGIRPKTVENQIRYVLLAKGVISRAKNLSAVSQYTADHISRYFGYKRPISIIPNAVIFEDELQVQKHVFREDAPVFVDVASWGRLKNVKTLMRAFKGVRGKIPGAKLILYGGGLEAGGAAWRWARVNNMECGIDFRGFAPLDLITKVLVEEADIFTHLSMVETFGHSICEGVAAGNPAIISKLGAGKDVLKESTAGRYVAPTNVKEATAAMLDVVKNYEACVAQLPKLQKIMRAEYSPENVVRKYLEVYSQILKRQVSV